MAIMPDDAAGVRWKGDRLLGAVIDDEDFRLVERRVARLDRLDDYLRVLQAQQATGAKPAQTRERKRGRKK